MNKFINLLILVVVAFAMNAYGATTTTNKVTTPSGNLTLDTASSAGEVEVASDFEVLDAVENSNPCPNKTDAEMLAIVTPKHGACVNNTTLNTWMRYNLASGMWEEIGGGISDWETAHDYVAGDEVIESGKLYRCDIDHTSGTFATDLAAGDWIIIEGAITGKSENGSVVTVEEIQVPNNQLTETDTNKHRIETGNGDLFANPSFEHATARSSWDGTILGITGSTSSDRTNGLQSYCQTFSGQTVDLHQDSALYEATYATMRPQGFGAIDVKTAINSTPIYVCARLAGSYPSDIPNSPLCRVVDTNDIFRTYDIDFVFGGTSNGYGVTSNGVAVTGTVCYDNAKLKAEDRSKRAVQCNQAACEKDFNAIMDTVGGVTSDDYDILNGNCVVSGTETKTCSFNSSIFTVAPSVTATNCTTSSLGVDQNVSITSISTSGFVATTRNLNNASSSAGVCFKISKIGADLTTANRLRMGTYFSTVNKDTDWASYAVTVSNLGSGSYTSEGRWKRSGQNLDLQIRMDKDGVAGTGAGVVEFSIPSGLTISSANATSSMAGVGKVYSSASTPAGNNLISFGVPGGNVVRIANGTSSLIGSSVTASSGWVINISVPINGWGGSNVIYGSFRNMMTVPGVATPVRYRADISSTDVVSNESGDFINGDCSDATAGQAACTFNSNIFSSGAVVRCWTEELATTAGNASVKCSPTANPTSSSVTLLCKQGTAGVNYGFTLFCEGQAP